MASKTLTPNEKIIAWRLATGRRISKEEFQQALYGNDPTGGPLSAYGNQISVYISMIQSNFKIKYVIIDYTFGWYIEETNLDHFRDLLVKDLLTINVHWNKGNTNTTRHTIARRIKQESM